MVTVEKLEKNMVKLTIEVSAEEFEKAVQAAYLKQRKNLTIPGFRKGKAPRAMVEKMYGAGIFFEEAANSLIPDAYENAARECGEVIVSQPVIDVVQIEKGKAFIFTAEVAVKPEVTLGEYKGLTVPASELEVTEEEIAAELKKEQENNSRTINVEDRAVVDGVAFEGGKGTDYPLTIGSNSFIPGFEAQLVGAEIGVETEVNVTFPEDYHSADLAGKAAVFKCTIKKIEVKELPELDDDFAQDVSEFDTMEEYKEDVKKNLEAKKAEAAKQAKEDAAVDAAVANATMEIPEAMIETQVRQQMEDFANRMQSQGLSMEQYLQFTGMTEAALAEQMKPQAVKRIQARLVLEKIAEVENIQISDEKVDEELTKMAEQYKMDVNNLKAMLGDAEKEQIRADIAVQEAVTLIAEAAVEA